MGESRNDLLAWLNDLAQVGYTKIEQCGTGAAHCIIMDSIYRDVRFKIVNETLDDKKSTKNSLRYLQFKVPMSKVAPNHNGIHLHPTPSKPGTLQGRPILTPVNHTVYFLQQSSPDPLSAGIHNSVKRKRKRVERAFHDGLSSSDEENVNDIGERLSDPIWETCKPVPRCKEQKLTTLDGLLSDDEVIYISTKSPAKNVNGSSKKDSPHSKSSCVFVAPLPKTHEPDDLFM